MKFDFLFLSPAAISSVTAAFLASLVEFVEALTIVLAVGSTRGWKWALWGTVAGVLLLTILVAAFGPALQALPLARLQLVIGILLLLFGLRWLRKAVLRSAGIIALHDETKIFEKQTKLLQEANKQHSQVDLVAFFTAFKAVVLEGLEVVFIVVATGSATHSLPAAAMGAAAAGIVVIVAGWAVHRPLSRVPENTLKFCVGLLLSAFGTFWVGEGLGLAWPGQDLSLLALIAGFALVAFLGIPLARRRLV